jgi:hypothetical protein
MPTNTVTDVFLSTAYGPVGLELAMAARAVVRGSLGRASSY